MFYAWMERVERLRWIRSSELIICGHGSEGSETETEPEPPTSNRMRPSRCGALQGDRIVLRQRAVRSTRPGRWRDFAEISFPGFFRSIVESCFPWASSRAADHYRWPYTPPKNLMNHSKAANDTFIARSCKQEVKTSRRWSRRWSQIDSNMKAKNEKLTIFSLNLVHARHEHVCTANDHLREIGQRRWGRSEAIGQEREAKCGVKRVCCSTLDKWLLIASLACRKWEC